MKNKIQKFKPGRSEVDRVEVSDPTRGLASVDGEPAGDGTEMTRSTDDTDLDDAVRNMLLKPDILEFNFALISETPPILCCENLCESKKKGPEGAPHSRPSTEQKIVNSQRGENGSSLAI